MLKVDEFESVFRSALKETYRHQELVIFPTNSRDLRLEDIISNRRIYETHQTTFFRRI